MDGHGDDRGRRCPGSAGGWYRPATDTWLPISSVNSADNGEGTAVWTGTEMIVWGGLDGTGYSTTTAAATTPPLTSGIARTMNVPSRAAAFGGVDGSEMMVWGGYACPHQHRRALHPRHRLLEADHRTGAPSARGAPPPSDGQRSDLLGRLSRDVPEVGTGGRYDPVADTCGRELAKAPNERYGHSAIWTGSDDRLRRRGN
jgi:hypothetical protein